MDDQEYATAIRDEPYSVQCCLVPRSRDRGYLATIQVSPHSDHPDGLKHWLCNEMIPGLAVRAGLCGAHLLVSDREVSQIKTQEKQLRGGSDAVSDWVILVEGYDRIASESALAELSDGTGLVAHGARENSIAGLYTLDYMIDEAEAKKAWNPQPI